MAFPPRDKSLQGLLKDVIFRLNLVERRLGGNGGGGASGGSNSGEGWTDLRSFLATGITYAADGSSTLAGIRARRIGGFVELSLGNLIIDTLSVPTSGNVANRTLLNAIPAKFRPWAARQSVAVGTAPSGRVTSEGTAS
jgi:hypothetical protein